MGHDWVIAVLTDLRRFAQMNDLPRLTEQMDQALAVAEAEIAPRRAKAPRAAAQPERHPPPE